MKTTKKHTHTHTKNINIGTQRDELIGRHFIEINECVFEQQLVAPSIKRIKTQYKVSTSDWMDAQTPHSNGKSTIQHRAIVPSILNLLSVYTPYLDIISVLLLLLGMQFFFLSLCFFICIPLYAVIVIHSK